MWQRAGKVDDVLTGPAGDLNDQPAFRQDRPEDGKNGLFVPIRSRRGLPSVLIGEDVAALAIAASVLLRRCKEQ